MMKNFDSQIEQEKQIMITVPSILKEDKNRFSAKNVCILFFWKIIFFVLILNIIYTGKRTQQIIESFSRLDN